MARPLGRPLDVREVVVFEALLLGRVLKCEDFAGVELDEHCTVCFQLFHGYREAEVVEKKELQFEVVELSKW